MRYSVLFLCLVSLLLAISCNGSPIEDEPFSGKIAAVVDPFGPFEGPYNVAGETTIYIFLPQTDEYGLLPEAWKRDQWGGWNCPQWSPDGSKLAVVNWDLVQGGFGPYGYEGVLYIANSDGTALIELTDTNSCAAWSPDGERLVFLYQGTLYVMDVATRKRTTLIQLSPATFQLSWSPDWSPDGTTIVYETDDAIYELDIGDLQVTRLTDLCQGCDYNNPCYSPDGQQIVFAWILGVEHSRNGIYVMHRDGTHVTWLHSGVLPTWAPDGHHIAFIDSGRKVFVIKDDGTGARLLLNSQRWDFMRVDWGP